MSPATAQCDMTATKVGSCYNFILPGQADVWTSNNASYFVFDFSQVGPFVPYAGQKVNWSSVGTFVPPCGSAQGFVVDCITDLGYDKKGVFLDFPFVSNHVDPSNCTGAFIEVFYDQAAGQYVYIRNGSEGNLYLNNDLICTTTNNTNQCVFDVGISEDMLQDTWNCGQDPLNCDDGDCTNGVEVWDTVSASCVIIEQPVIGCTIVGATNYNPQANCSAGNPYTPCEFIQWTDGTPSAGVQSYNPSGGFCPPACSVSFLVSPTVTTTYTYTNQNNFNCIPNFQTFTVVVKDCGNCPDPGTCVVGVDCLDGYETWDSENCECVVETPVFGCTTPGNINYNSLATCDDGTCAGNPAAGVDGMTTCLEEGEYLQILAAFFEPCGGAISISPSEGTILMSQGLADVYLVSPQVTTTYTITFLNDFCQTETKTVTINIDCGDNPGEGPNADCYNPANLFNGIDCDVYGYDPVCSCGNITYNNICEAFYLNGLDEYTVGECIGNPNPDPPCGCDEVTYYNSCAATWIGKVSSYTLGACPGDPVPPVIPAGCIDTNNLIAGTDCSSYGFDPVCGCDGITYDNICEAYFLNGLTQYTVGACTGTNPPVNPPVDPPSEPDCYDASYILPSMDCSNDAFDPVCACDGVTYNNICEAYFINGLDEYTLGACTSGLVQVENFLNEKSAPTIICHDGHNKLGEKIVHASASRPSEGTIRFFNQQCFQFIPSAGFSGSALFAVSWYDKNGLSEKSAYEFKVSGQEEVAASIESIKVEQLSVRYGETKVWFVSTIEDALAIEYEIYSISGALIKRDFSSNPQWSIETNSLSPGVYIIRSGLGNQRFLVR